jgi:hypothetical protein
MMLVIKHLTGPLKDKEEKIDPKLDRVVFGRNLDCQVVYPPEFTIVSREHFALVRKPPGPLGHWSIDLFGEPFVAVNGVPAEQGQKVAENTTFELGKRGGPSFKVHLEADAPVDNKLRTAQQAARPSLFVLNRSTRRTAVLGVALAVFAVAAATYFYSVVSNYLISNDVRARVTNATYLVEVPGSGGTAVVIGPHMLATNSHVAILFDQLKPGEKMQVRSPGLDGKTYDVVKHELHPGYEAFQAFLGQDVLRARAAQIDQVGGYDVALLWVKEDLPKDDILQLADADELKALAPGTVVATAGYPMEGVIGSGSQVYGATPEFHDGTITGLTDFFFLPADFARGQLVHHDLAAAGGSSGSPIVGRSGHILALLDAGNSYQPQKNGPRIPSGVLINYGQRIDMLQHLINGDADQEVAQDQKYWQQQIATFPDGQKIAVEWMTDKVRQAAQNQQINLTAVSEQTSDFSQQNRIATANGGFQRQFDYQVPVSAGNKYVFGAYAYDGSPIQIWVYDGNQLVAHDEDASFLSYVQYQPATSDKLDVWVIAPKDQDLKYSFMAEKIAAPGT